MRPLAVWLLARPERAVFLLIAASLLPITPILGSAVMVLLVLSRGFARATLIGGIASAAILVLALVSTLPVSQLLKIALTIWLPGMILALLLQRMRSLTLLLQSTVLIAMIALVGAYIVLGDPAAYWQGMLEHTAALWRETGLQQEADLIVQLQPLAPHMTGIFVSVAWLSYAAAVIAGYAAYSSLPGQPQRFGRFAGLNFGRVLALVLAATSIAATITAAIWLQNLALVLFVTFWLQGLAILHWLRGQGRLPTVALAAVYVLTFLLGWVLVPAVGVIGYTDAWFNFRSRIAGK